MATLILRRVITEWRGCEFATCCPHPSFQALPSDELFDSAGQAGSLRPGEIVGTSIGHLANKQEKQMGDVNYLQVS